MKTSDHYVPRRRDNAERVELPKANTTLVVRRILENIPFPMKIMSKLIKLSFEDFNTHLQQGLKRADCMVPDQTNPTGA